MSHRPMTMAHTRALAMACDLHRTLGELYDLLGSGAGSRIERAWDRMDDVVALLDDEDALRFLKGSPAPKLASLVLAHRYGWSEPSCKPVGLPGS